MRVHEMSSYQLNISQAVQEAFDHFIDDKSLLALPLHFEEDILSALPALCYKSSEELTTQNLSLLDEIVNPKRSLFLFLRLNDSIFGITFVPYRAPKYERELYLQHRDALVKSLGEKHFKTTLICKEVGEVTDTRSWVERAALQQDGGTGEDPNELNKATIDEGYKRTKCRLCDRRMKNQITDDAFEALGSLEKEGECVQLSLNSDLILSLDMQTSSLPPAQVSSHLPTTHPTFTFYRHPNSLVYFIFHSPDSATVQQRMKHTMAIPGLVNIHAEDCGVHVDQKIEIHEPEDLVFNESDEKVGKFRSMYLRGDWQGTESQYEGLEKDKKFYDAVR